MFAESADLIFYELAALLIITGLAGIAAMRLRQPLIIAFIFSGVLVSLPLIPVKEIEAHLDLLASMGVTLLLFVVGLRLDVSMVRTTGRVALATGVGQIVFTSAFGFVLCLVLGMDWTTALYVAVALTFSSTIIIVKLLSDKREVDSLHGRIAIGFLIVQDIAVIVAMVLLVSLSVPTAQGETMTVMLSLLMKGAAFLIMFGVVARFIIPRILKSIGRSSEVLILFAIAWAIFLAAVSGSLGFSQEVGAFLAGVAIASTPYRDLIGPRLTPLRDFLLLFFFVELGMSLEFSLLGEQMVPAVVLSLFVLVGNPLIVMTIMGRLGYQSRTGFLAGLTVAQISEFSLILAKLGVSAGHLSREALGLITLVGLVTIAASTYLILYSHIIYGWLARWLVIFDRLSRKKVSEYRTEKDIHADVIIVGLGRYGLGLAESLRSSGLSVHGVDFDPVVLEKWRQAGYSVQYGDANDFETASSLPLTTARYVVSTLPDVSDNRMLITSLREHGYNGRIALMVRRRETRSEVEKMAPDTVFHPFEDAAKQAAQYLQEQIGGSK